MENNYILIVDDDPNIRVGLTKEIEKEFKSKATILSCKNGAIAADLLTFNTIDILITDIKMPIMNGIDLLKFVKDNNIMCKSIVLSSYDDFNLVRDAMRLGAYDYLLKPVNFPTLHQMIHKLLAQVSLEHNSLMSNETFYNSQELLEHYLQTNHGKTAHILAFEEKYKLTDSSPCIIGCKKMPPAHTSMLYKLQESLRSNLYTQLNIANISYHTILTGELDSCFVFVLFPETDPDQCLGILRDHLKQMEDNDSYQLHNFVTALGDSHHAFKDCLRQLELNYYELPYNNTYSTCNDNDLNSALNSAVEALSIYDLSETLHHLTRFFSIINHLKPAITDTKKHLHKMMYDLIRSNPKYIEPLSKTKFTKYDIFNHIEDIQNLSGLQKEIFNSLSHLIGEVIDSLPNKTECIIEKSIAYIENNYNEYITLNDVASHVFLNKNYFSTLFKNHIGMTYTEYLRNYRIEKAISLIKETDMKLYEIANAVGYNDAAHFSRTLKEVTGHNPSHYRN